MSNTTFALLFLIGICILIRYAAKKLGKKRTSQGNSYRNNSFNANTSVQINHSNSRYASMPSDAHDQVEALAHLIDEVYKAYPFAKNDFAKGSLFIYQENNKTTINFWYDWDYSGIQSFLEARHTFGSSFSFPDAERISYVSSSVTGLKQWLWSDILKRYYVDPAVATLQNNCPGLYITDQQIYDTGIMLKFSYR